MNKIKKEVATIKLFRLFLIVFFALFLLSCKDSIDDNSINDKNDDNSINDKNDDYSIKISFYVENSLLEKTIENRKVITIDDVPIEDKGTIVGIYYDKDFESAYDNKEVEDGTILYVKVDKSFIIKYHKDSEVIEIKYNESKVVTLDDVPFNTDLLEDIYYDKEFTKKYDSSAISKQTDLYIKYGEPSFAIGFYISTGIIIIKQYIREHIAQVSEIQSECVDEVIGLYYDSRYNEPYDNKPISESTYLFVKLDGVDYSSIISIDFIVEGNTYHSGIYPGSRISNDTIQGYDFKELIQGIYYDENYEKEYKGERVEKPSDPYNIPTFYVKTLDEFIIRFIIKGEDVDVRFNETVVVTKDIIPVDNKDKIKFLGYSRFKEYDNSPISKSTRLYVYMEDHVVSCVYNGVTKEVVIQDGTSLWRSQVPFEAVYKGYLDSEHMVEYSGEVIYEDLTIYLDCFDLTLSDDEINIIKSCFDSSYVPGDIHISHYYGEYNGYYVVSIANSQGNIEYNREICGMRFNNFQKDHIYVLSKSDYSYCLIDRAYENGYLTSDDVKDIYEQYLIVNERKWKE